MMPRMGIVFIRSSEQAEDKMAENPGSVLTSAIRVVLILIILIVIIIVEPWNRIKGVRL